MKIGILGGGQLARMLILAGIPMGFKFIVYTDRPSNTTRHIAETMCGDYTDVQKISELAAVTDTIIYENENIPHETIAILEKTGLIHPSSKALAHMQDRLYEKNLFQQLYIKTPRFFKIDHMEDLEKAIQEIGFPIVIKSRRGGYDGKNQFVIENAIDLDSLKTESLKNFIAEEFVAFDREVSIIGARNAHDQTVFYDLCENQHKKGILRVTKNKPTDPLFSKAKEYLTRIMTHLNYIGVAALELFVKDAQLLANEIAPRVHNSGHWTIEGTLTSQFENHIRACAGLPLGSTDSTGYCAMLNCIGEMPDIKKITEISGAHYHDYLKVPKLRRKLGHITCVSKDKEGLTELINSIHLKM
jgi:5-(carboxyamino)imidazole ribonucleotide synthase